MAQLAKCLLCRYENLSTNPQQAHKKLGMMVGTPNPSHREAGKQDLEAGGAATLAELVSSRFRERTCVKI